MAHETLPAHSLPKAEVFAEMAQASRQDVDWRGGRLPGFYMHFASDAVEEVGMEALERFHATNALGVGAFPSIGKFESDLVDWTLGLLHAAEGCGSVTSGGTESIFLGVKTAREWARATRGVARPNMVIPFSAHPAFDKAAKYLCIESIRVPLRDDFTADVEAMKRAVDGDTIFMCGSAPQFTHGTIDDIAALAAFAKSRNIWFHTDACVGGFFSPFAEMLGHEVPPWDFRVEGVRSISADLHKYGFAPKGASTITFSDSEARRYQVFDFDNWSRGRYVTPTFAGTRPGANVAAAWAVMRFLGREGYCSIVARILSIRDRLRAGIEAIPGLSLCGDPKLSVMAYSSDCLPIDRVAAGLSAHGWYTVAPSPNPPAINLGILSLAFGEKVDDYLADLGEIVAAVRAGETYAAARVGSYGSASR